MGIQPGSRIDEPVIFVDSLPTIFEIGGGHVGPTWKLDGRSHLPPFRQVAFSFREWGVESSLCSGRGGIIPC